VYLRGAMVLGELRELLGADAFQEFLRDYLSTFRYRQARGDDFFNLLTEYTSADISGLVGRYFVHR
ncbi:MAG: M1 family aminopeptidase, partial [Anaerolineales bacterium]